jgi:hypothetical protein
MALWLSSLAAGAAFPQQPPAANSAGQAPAAEHKAPESAAKKKSTSSTSTSKKQKPSAPAPGGGPRKVVVREGGANEPAAQIVPGMALAEATRQRQNAEQWLGSAGVQLNQLAGRTLSAQQQETVGQIHNYMDGARLALQDGDVRRASTLAEKARLLAEDLVKHQ